jgi:hypothetical protein
MDRRARSVPQPDGGQGTHCSKRNKSVWPELTSRNRDPFTLG